MELFKHSNHRNNNYLAWLREQRCLISGEIAQCAHHIRLGTNGGTALKPSDYFCIPLTNDYHTAGLNALHRIGEETFINKYSLDIEDIFIKQLKQFLLDKHSILFNIDQDHSKREVIASLIDLIELNTKPSKKASKTKLGQKKKSLDKKESIKKVIQKNITRKKIEKSEYEKELYEKSKILKRQRDKELRDKLKARKKNANSQSSIKISDNPLYEKAKAYKKKKDKELRELAKQKRKQAQMSGAKSKV